jgi:YVTN family beta-propeller protein
VTVINGTTNSVIKTLTVSRYPLALVYDSLNNKIYCASRYSDNVTVIDCTSDSVITTVQVGTEPCALVYNSLNNKVYCANLYSHNVTVIDGATNSVITTIPVGDGPIAFTWNPIQNRTYVANYWSNTVSVIRDSMIIGIKETPNSDAISLMPEIYPIPAKGVIRVRCPFSVNEPADLKIFDVSGKLIREIATAPPRNDRNDMLKVSLKGINPGIYFLRFGKETKKFLIVK